MRYFIGSGFALALALLPVAASATVANFSFETPQLGSSSAVGTPSGPSVSWAFSGHSGIASSGPSAPFLGDLSAPNGTQVAFVQGIGGESGSISQLLAGLTSGDAYKISFSISLRGDGPYAGNATTVVVDGSSLGAFTPTTASFATVTTASFIATGETALLSFSGSTSVADIGTLLDNILVTDVSNVTFGNVTSVPEPATMALLVTGIMGLVLVRRIRAN